MSKCLRCGAGNEWIEPVRSERPKPKPKRRPKVRYTAFNWGTFKGRTDPDDWRVHEYDHAGYVAKCPTGNAAKRIASALNVYEARRRGELT